MYRYRVMFQNNGIINSFDYSFKSFERVEKKTPSMAVLTLFTKFVAQSILVVFFFLIFIIFE